MAHIGYFDYDRGTPAARAAFDEEVRQRGGVSNMKRTLLHSVPALEAYLGWYSLRDTVAPIIGERALAVFAHAISSRNQCLLCSTYFRLALTELGLSPDGFAPTADEALLIELAESVVRHAEGVPSHLWTRLKARYSDAELVNLVAFAGLMVATNLFNNVVGVALDEKLLPYRKI